MALLNRIFARPRARSAGGRHWGLVAAAIGLALLLPSVVRAQGANPKEYQIKAVFLFNFIQFTTWPEAAFADATDPIRIGVLGDDPFGGALAAVVQGEKVGARSVMVMPLARVQEATGCHVVFVSRSEAAQVPAILSALGNRPVLTVGDMPDFARRGGVINFYLDDLKVRFEINRSVARRNGFRLSSQLLALARLVGPAITAEEK